MSNRDHNTIIVTLKISKIVLMLSDSSVDIFLVDPALWPIAASTHDLHPAFLAVHFSCRACCSLGFADCVALFLSVSLSL